jgi:K+-sensing histidine kinase KdpD
MNEKNLNSITDEMSRLIELVNTIMEYEKFENKKLELHTSVEDIAEILEEVVETHSSRLTENKQSVQIDNSQSLFLDIDTSLFKQLTHNLIGNFLKYAGP